MAYTKTEWKDQVVENPRTYSMRDNGDNTVTLLDAFGTVTELGTPVNAVNMNHIEDGIKNNESSITNLATTVDTKADNNSVVHLTGNEDINGDKTFLGLIKGESGNYTNHAIELGKNQQDYMNFYEYGATWNFYKSRQNTNTLVAKIGESTNATNDVTLATTQWVKNILAALYPVGSIYIGTQNTCPLATLISGSTWQLVAQDRALWGGNGSNGNSTINAGLPNISGNIRPSVEYTGSDYADGAFNRSAVSGLAVTANFATRDMSNYKFDASRSNSIYGKSSTVQPPAYRVNVWRRTA